MRVRVTFKQHFPIELVEVMQATDFAGLSIARDGDDPRTLHLEPTLEQYRNLISQLEELEREGALTFAKE